MCVTAFWFGLKATNDHNGYRLILVFNRDEFFSKPSASASFWQENDDIVGGLDMTEGREGGTWLAMNRNGRLALLTNVIGPDGTGNPNPEGEPRKFKGRGSLVRDFVSGCESSEEFLRRIANEGHLYRGFNIITIDLKQEKVRPE